MVKSFAPGPIKYAPETDFFYTGVVNYRWEGVSGRRPSRYSIRSIRLTKSSWPSTPESAWVMRTCLATVTGEMTERNLGWPQSALLPLGENHFMLSVAFWLFYILWPASPQW